MTFPMNKRLTCLVILLTPFLFTLYGILNVSATSFSQVCLNAPYSQGCRACQEFGHLVQRNSDYDAKTNWDYYIASEETQSKLSEEDSSKAKLCAKCESIYNIPPKLTMPFECSSADIYYKERIESNYFFWNHSDLLGKSGILLNTSIFFSSILLHLSISTILFILIYQHISKKKLHHSSLLGISLVLFVLISSLLIFIVIWYFSVLSIYSYLSALHRSRQSVMLTALLNIVMLSTLYQLGSKGMQQNTQKAHQQSVLPRLTSKEESSDPKKFKDLSLFRKLIVITSFLAVVGLMLFVMFGG